MTTESQPQIRPAERREAGAIRDLVRIAYARWVPVIGREPRPMQADYDAAFAIHQFDIIEIDGRLSGVIETTPEADHFWIENVAVHPDAQGKGIGRLLLAHAERTAIGIGCPEIRLLTNGAFAANLALYQRLGYRIDRQEPFMGGLTVYPEQAAAEAQPAA